MTENEPIGNSDWWFKELDQQVVDGVRCDFIGCNKLSEWWFQVICCKEVYLMCTEHTHGVVYVVRNLPVGRGVMCRFCHGVWNSLDYMTVPKKLDSSSDV